MPSQLKITSRTSSITNAFANAIIPVVFPTEKEVAEALGILGLDANDLRCAYCGDVSTEWDHLRPLIVDRRPTGYISEIANLVPACGKCNQSKGNKNWQDWITSNARLSPKTRGIPDLESRIQRLEMYEAWRDIKPIDFSALIDEELWETYWRQWEAILSAMKKGQQIAENVKKCLADNYQHSADTQY